MVQKQLQLTFSFDQVAEFLDEAPYLELVSIERSTDLSDSELESLGDSVAQTDRWQVEIWQKIQELLSNPESGSVEFV